MRRTGHELLLVLCGTCLMPAIAAAQPPVAGELLLFTQEELAVTATRTTKPISESPSSTTVITRDDIMRSGLWHIPDLLRRVPGVDVASTTAGQSEVNIRGLNKALSARTLVLVDGRTVFVNGQGFTPWEALPLLIDDVDRIEVVKGPVQALYGSPALAGVVNVITRSPFDVNGVEVTQRYGSQHLLQETVVQGARLSDSLAYKIAGGWKEWDAFEGVNKDAVDQATGTAAVEWRPQDGTRVGVSAGLSDGDFDLLTSDATGVGPMEHRTEFTELNLQHEGFRAQYFWNRYTFNVTTSNLDEDLTINSHDVDVSQQITAGPHTLLGGVGARFEQIDSNLFRPFAETKTETTWDMFAQDEWHLCGPLTWYGTVRVDRHPITDFNVAYRTSLLYEPVENHVMWGTIGRTFRNPTFSESKIDLTFGVLDTPGVSTRSIGREDLKAETMQSYELGYRSRWFDRLKLDTSVFYNRLNHAIGTSTVDFDPLTLTTTTMFLNEGRANILGTEIGAEVLVLPWLTSFASWSYQDVQRLKDLTEHDVSPAHKATLGFTSTYGKLSGELFLQFVDVAEAPGDRGGLADAPGEIKSFWWSSARLGYTINDHATLALVVYNLLHDVHREHPAGQELGTRILAQATVKF